MKHFKLFEGSVESIEEKVNNFLHSQINKITILETNLSTTWVFVNHDDKGMNVYFSILYETEEKI